MSHSRLRYAVYSRLPVCFQNLLVTHTGNKRWKHESSEPFQEIVRELMKLQFSSTENIRSYQKQRLIGVLKAAKNTDFYSTILPDSATIEQDPFQVLLGVPVLCKDQIRGNTSAFINRDFQGKLIRHGTSGTTGMPLQTIWTERCIDMERALIWRQRLQTGLEFGSSWRAMLGGHRIVPLSQKKPPYWRINKNARQLYMSTYHLSPETAAEYADALDKYQVKALEGYPSVLYALAYALNRKSLKFSLEGIYYGAEPMQEFQKDLLAKVFECHVWDYYGLTERNASASQYECRSGLHENWENCILEIVDTKGSVLAKGEYGELVGTSLSNLGFPILRYRTGDMTSFIPGKCNCGRDSRRIRRIDTKREDLLLLKDGSLLSASNLTYPFKEVDNILESQLYQPSVETLEIRLVPSPDYSDHDGEKLLKGLRQLLPESLIPRIVIVDAIPRTESGKFRFCISVPAAQINC